MAESLIYVPESDEQKATKVLTERVALALGIAKDGCARFARNINLDPEDNLPTNELFVSVFEQVFAALS